MFCISFCSSIVALHWGAWIEIHVRRCQVATCLVAPHWGAWIEILPMYGRKLQTRVAPHWGAWIEIGRIFRIRSTCESHPTGVRGLKSSGRSVAARRRWSHPTGVRGLKYHRPGSEWRGCQSHPTGVRGLKLDDDRVRGDAHDARRAHRGAWIEIGR